MDLASPKFFQAPSLFPSNGEPTLETSPVLYGKSKGNPFADTFTDPLCKLNLKETSEFVKSFPMAAAANSGAEIKGNGFVDVSGQRRREGVNSVTAIQRRSMDAPSTPGRPVFSFSSGNLARKTFPSKWDDAQKWLINGSNSCHESSALAIKPADCSKMPKQFGGFKQQMEVIAEKSRVTEEKVSKVVSSFQGSVALDHHRAFHGVTGSTDFLLKDKFTDEVETILPHIRSSEPSKEGFLFRNSSTEAMQDAGTETTHEVKHRDIGTEMTPLGSSTTSRCHTPFKSSSPARHNTPANRSGPLASENNVCNGAIDITQLEECHLAKLQLGTQYDSVTSIWSSREEEEEEVSKSLRHFEISNTCRRSVSESRAAAWEEEEKTKCCLRYQREEAKIQAWVNLQNAKAEAQSRKLEVKIQKMRSNLEEKLMKRMAIVHRKAEEWRAAAQQQHSEQMQKATGQSHKMMNRQNVQVSSHNFCGCFPCNTSH